VPGRPTGLSTAQRLLIVVGAVAVIVVAFVIIRSSGGDDKPASTSTAATTAPGGTAGAPATTTPSGTATTTRPAPKPAVATVRVVDAKPQGGIKKLTFAKDGQVRFRVVSDTADEIHVHGYDLMKDIPKGGSVTFSFPASIDGRFVVELEARGVQIAELDVEP
jgi:hypothetical protein